MLNRALREAVLAAIEGDGVTLGELAIRCGHGRPDARGRLHGDTSWLARRIGLVAEAGAEAPTPWVHSDVLALIAREALSLAPLDVELG